MSDRFATAILDPRVRHDVRVLGDFVAIWCDGHHADRPRAAATTDGARENVYGRRVPVLCDECAAHLGYAEKRRAYCPKDPKPFCAHCDTHCYSSNEAEWQRQMMRYSGPKSWRKGHAIDGVKHVLEKRKYRRLAAQKAAAATSAQPTQDPKGTRS